MNCVIGVDIGTQSTKGIVVDAGGKILASSSVTYGVINKKPLWAEQHPDVWLRAAKQVIKELVDTVGIANESIRAVCISSLYGGAGIPVDEKIAPLYPCLIWMDRRAEEEVNWVQTNVDTERLFRISGNSCDSYYGYTKILWIKNNEQEVWEKTKYFVPPNSYVNFHLTGELAVDHSSAANIGGVYDMQNRKWSEQALDMLGIPSSMMPKRLVASGEITGGMLTNAAEEVGLKPGTPFVAGGVDAAVATYAAGVCAPGDHVAMIGTSMCWGFINKSTDAKHGLISMPHVVNSEEDIYVFGGAITAGASISWFINEFCQAEEIEAEESGKNVHTLLEEKASTINPGSDGLIFLPYLMGERSPVWDSQASGVLLGLSLFHSRHHIYRAIIEGVTFALRDNMECGKAGAEKLNEKLIVVGGASFSDMWMQIIADITGYPVLTLAEEVEAPLGDCALAAAAVGLIDRPEKIKDWSTLIHRAEPDPRAHSMYSAMFEEYLSVYRNSKENMHRLHQISSSINE